MLILFIICAVGILGLIAAILSADHFADAKVAELNELRLREWRRDCIEAAIKRRAPPPPPNMVRRD